MATKPVNGGNPGAAGIFAPQVPAAKTGEAKEVKQPLPAGYGDLNAKQGDRGSANVQISTSAKERAEAQKKAFDIAKATPEIREDKVADLKARIQAGTYQIDSGKIADGMLREAIMEHLADGEG